MTETQHIGIIGAGVAGLAAAWDFVNAGHEVTIYEAGDRVGGLAAGFKDDSWDWELEKFYHHWFTSDADMLGLIDEIGHSDKVIFPRPKTSYWIDGKPVRSEMNLSALFLPISLWGTFRMGLGGVYLKLTSDWRALEKVTADSWMRRYMGPEGYEKFFKPLLIGKFSEDYDKVNMAWMWARVKARSVKLGTFEGGFQNFLNLMGQTIEAKGAVIKLGTPVEGIGTRDGKPTLTINGETQVFDAVLSTVSPRLMLKLTDGLAETDYGQQMADLKSIGGVVVVAALKQQLLTDGTYWLNLPADSPDRNRNQFPYLALVEHTNFLDKANYGGDHLIYMGDYVAPDHEYFTLSDDELAERFMAPLKQVNPNFDPSWVRKTWVFRAPYAQPVPALNHSEKIPGLKTPLPGLYWASMSQVYPWDRGTNFAVELGRRTARLILGKELNANAVKD
ncbi:MAG: NAD(P)/FAD-dependent oxidoreductase [Anaerolineae bacterium]|nr:NAD(P)/FAD-dependent oxidoreductase [Anaerolineae bacterium]